MKDFAFAWNTGKARKQARFVFPTRELLWKVIMAKGWELLKAMCGAGHLTVREVARRVSRDLNRCTVT